MVGHQDGEIAGKARESEDVKCGQCGPRLHGGQGDEEGGKVFPVMFGRSSLSLVR